jgi:hypothetical protein
VFSSLHTLSCLLFSQQSPVIPRISTNFAQPLSIDNISIEGKTKNKNMIHKNAGAKPLL